MLLEHRVLEVTQSEPIKTLSVGIGSEVVMIELLRSGVYKNPDRVICQEYAANARDAHREVGTPERPIEITLPTIGDSSLIIQDWGPGISPDRMDNVFRLLGASTKNDDDVQNGGYGIGAKCAWSKVDSFNIVTVVDKVKYFYIAYIDESLKGALNLVDQFDCDEPNGTTITIPVAKEDHNKYKSWVAQVTEHWSPRPIVKPEITYEETDKAWKGTRWWIGSEQDGNDSIAIVDGIPYKIELDQLRDLEQMEYGVLAKTLLAGKQVFLEFNTGEVKVAASRENLRYNKHTSQIIIERSKVVVTELFELLAAKIEIAENFKELCKSLNKVIFDDHGFSRLAQFFPKFRWKDVEIDLGSLPPIFSGNYSSYRSQNTGSIKHNGVEVGSIQYYYLNKRHGNTVISIDKSPHSSRILDENTIWGVSTKKGCSRPFLRELITKNKVPVTNVSVRGRSPDGIVVFSLKDTPEAEDWKKSVHFKHYACIDIDVQRTKIGPQARLPRSLHYETLSFAAGGLEYSLDNRLLDTPIIPKGCKFYLLKTNKIVPFYDRMCENTQYLAKWFDEGTSKLIPGLFGETSTMVYIVTKEILDELRATDPTWQEFSSCLKEKILTKAAKWTPEYLDFISGWKQTSNVWSGGSEYLRNSEFERYELILKRIDDSIKAKSDWAFLVSFVALASRERGLSEYNLYSKFVPNKPTEDQGKRFEASVIEFKKGIRKLVQKYPLLKIVDSIYRESIEKINFKHLSFYIKSVDQLSCKEDLHDHSI